MAGSEYYKLKVFSKSCLFVIGSSFLLSCLVCSPRIHILPPSQVAAKDLVAVHSVSKVEKTVFSWGISYFFG